MEYLTFLKIVHLLGMTSGLGGALYADYLILTRGVLTPLQPATLAQVKQLAGFVLIGLAVLWISGVLLALHILGTNPEFLSNEKFWAKMTIVSVLTVNGFAVHSFILDRARQSLGKRLLLDHDAPTCLAMILAGSVSFVSWCVPFILGKAPEFSYVIPYLDIMAVWIAAVMAVASLVLAAVSGLRTILAREQNQSRA